MHDVSLPHVFIDVSEEQRGAIKLLRTQHSYHPIRTGHAQVQARRRERPGERRRRIAADGKPETTPATRFQCFARGLGCIEQDRFTALRSTRSGRARASPARPICRRHHSLSVPRAATAARRLCASAGRERRGSCSLRPEGFIIFTQYNRYTGLAKSRPRPSVWRVAAGAAR